MSQEVHGLQNGQCLRDEFRQYEINGKKYYVVAEIKKGHYTRVYFDGELVAELPVASKGAENMLLGLCEDWVKTFERGIASCAQKGQETVFPSKEGYRLKYVAGDRIYAYVDGYEVDSYYYANGDEPVYNTYEPTVLGFLKARFEADKMAEQLKEKENRQLGR